MPIEQSSLIRLSKAGDVDAFDKLVFIHQDKVFALAYRMLANEEDAADIQQETFIRAWRELPKFRGNAAFSTWLHRITVNLCISHKRRRRPVTVDISALDEVIRTHNGDTLCLERTETIVAARRILSGMPAHYRALIVLRDMENRTFEEIAEILGCSIPSARSRLCKARNVLRERMRPYIEEEGL